MALVQRAIARITSGTAARPAPEGAGMTEQLTLIETPESPVDTRAEPSPPLPPAEEHTAQSPVETPKRGRGRPALTDEQKAAKQRDKDELRAAKQRHKDEQKAAAEKERLRQQATKVGMQLVDQVDAGTNSGHHRRSDRRHPH
jgi:hypothetical protein